VTHARTLTAVTLCLLLVLLVMRTDLGPDLKDWLVRRLNDLRWFLHDFVPRPW